jgi:hypothetical protein
VKALLLGSCALALLVTAVWSSGADATSNGTLILSTAGVLVGLSTLRVLPKVRSSSISRPAGIGLTASLTLGGVVLIAGTAQRGARAAELATIERAAAEGQRLEMLAAQFPALLEELDAVFESVDAGQLDEAKVKIGTLENRISPLRGSSLGSRPGIRVGFERLEDSKRALVEAINQRGIDAANATLAARKTGSPALVGLLQVRAALRALEQPSAASVQTLAAVDQRLVEVGRKLPALNQAHSLLEAKLGSQLGALRADGSRVLGGFSGAQAFSLSTADRSTALYLVAEPRDGTLSPATVNSFLEVALGAIATTALERPTGKGSRATTTTMGPTPVHAGWADGRLVEVWVGDFRP